MEDDDDEDNHHNDNAAMQHPLMEMSQDCMIEWDESKNLDLRQIIAKSPHYATTPGRSTSSASASASSSGFLLSDIRRRLEKSSDGTTTNGETSPSSLSSLMHTQPPPHSYSAPSKKSKNNHREQEIDGIFSILQKEEECLDGHSPHSAPTQRFEHCRRVIPSIPPKTTTTTALASRHRRRRREAEYSNSSSSSSHNKRQQKSKPAVDTRFCSPNPSKHHTTEPYNNSEDDFQKLLKQMSTPQSETPPSRPPLMDIDKNLVVDDGPTQGAASTNDHGTHPPKPVPTQQPCPAMRAAAAAVATTSHMQTVPTPTAAATHRAHAKSQPQPPHQLVPPRATGHKHQRLPGTSQIAYQQQSTSSQPVAHQTAGQGILSKQHNAGQLVLPPKPIHAAKSRNHYVQQSQRMPAISSVSRTHALPPSRPTRPNDKLSMPPPPPLNGISNSNAGDDDDDEFGDLNLSADDMANLDSLLSITSSQQPLPQPKSTAPFHHAANSNRPSPPPPPKSIPKLNPMPTAAPSSTKPVVKKESSDEFGDFPDIDFDAIDQVNPTSAPSTKPVVKLNVLHTEKKQSPEDFGDFPDIDFDAIDQDIPSTKPVVKLNILHTEKKESPDDFGDFPDMDFDAIDQVISQRCTTEQSTQPFMPHTIRTQQTTNASTPVLAANGIVRNLKSDITDTNLSFITFSRYKVLNVVHDTTTYTKTLSVAAWTEAMLKDEENEKKIHRNCKVTRFDDLENPNVQQDDPSATYIRRNIDYPTSGSLHLRGEWYHTQVSPGDVAHLCSLKGRYRSDAQALPIILHTTPPPGSDVDDLVLIIHPDMLMTPTTVSETVSCSRRAVLKSRIGSTGLSSKAALVGTMRHALFALCMEEKNFDVTNVRRNVRNIVRQNAESLIGCGVSSVEAEREVFNVLPVIKRFVAEYTTIGQDPNNAIPSSPRKVVEGHGGHSDVRFVANSVHSTEEPIISHELALKGNVDAVFETTTETLSNQNHFKPNHHLRKAGPQHSLMSVELKTGHNQSTQNAHMAQLALYTLMLQIRYGSHLQDEQPSNPKSHRPDPKGAAPGGLLLYLNQESARSVHISPQSNEVKSLIGQRNVVASELWRASRPRGIALSYDKDSREDENHADQKVKLLPAPAAELPGVLPSTHSCTRCYANRECMLYAATVTETSDPNWSVRDSHKELMSKFTGQLKEDDLKYFRDWDRLIDLEAHASSNSVATAWLVDSQKREKEKGESVSSLVYERPEPLQGSRVLIVFRRSVHSQSQSSLESLSLSRGCYVIISTDGTSFDGSQSGPNSKPRTFRHHMHLVRGILERTDNDRLFVSARREDLERIRDMVERHHKLSGNKLFFRVDKDNSSVGIGTLRQNLINFFTADFIRREGEELSQTAIAKQRRIPWLRDVVIRLKPPSFDSRTPASFFNGPGPNIPGCDLQNLSSEFADLNPDQQKAVEKVMNAKDYTLIQGLPGTGKTSILAFIARLLAARGKRVLITSYTHSSVDNVMLKLMEKGLASFDAFTGLPRLIRLGQMSSCHRDVRPLVVSEVATQLDALVLDQNSCLSQPELSQDNPTAQSLKQVVSSAQIVCASALSVPRSPLLVNENFDVVIIDEAGQISQPAILGALMAADSFVLVGDHQQLPPLVNSEIAESGGYGVSMLKRLADKHPQSIAPLTYQYRMHEAICRLSSEAVYGGRLKCGNDEVRTRILDLPGFPSRLPHAVSKAVYPWLRRVIDPQNSVVFVDTDNIKTKPRSANELTSMNQNNPPQGGIEALETTIGGRVGGNITNPTEVTLVRFILKGLFSSGLPASSVGVISPFRAQLRILEDDPTIASWKKEGLELSTIDRYQGRDKPVIILSFVRSNSTGRAGRLLQDMRRLNVALTRAKCKLIIVGSFSTLKTGSDRLRPILARINKRDQRFLLPENAAECYRIP